MAQVRHFAMIHTDDQWRRVAHDNTSLQVEEGVVQLAWELDERDELDAERHPGTGGRCDRVVGIRDPGRGGVHRVPGSEQWRDPHLHELGNQAHGAKRVDRRDRDACSQQ